MLAQALLSFVWHSWRSSWHWHMHTERNGKNLALFDTVGHKSSSSWH